MCRIFRMLVLFLLGAFAVADGEPVSNQCPQFAQFYCGCSLNGYTSLMPINICFYENQEHPCHPCGVQFQEHVNCNDCPDNVCPICSQQDFGAGAKEESKDPDQIFFRFKLDGSILYLPKVLQNEDNAPSYKSALGNSNISSQFPELPDRVNENRPENSDTSNLLLPPTRFEDDSKNPNNMGWHIAHPWKKNSNNKRLYPVLTWMPYDHGSENANKLKYFPVFSWVPYEPGSENSNSPRQPPVLPYEYGSENLNTYRQFPQLPWVPHEQGSENSNALMESPILPKMPYEHGSENSNTLKQSPVSPWVPYKHGSENWSALKQPFALPWVPNENGSNNLNISSLPLAWPPTMSREGFPQNSGQKKRDIKQAGREDNWNVETQRFYRGIHGRNLGGEELYLSNSYVKRDTEAFHIMAINVEDSKGSSGNSDYFSANGTDFDETVKDSEDSSKNSDNDSVHEPDLDETFEDPEDSSEDLDDDFVNGTDMDETLEDSQDSSEYLDYDHGTDMDETLEDSEGSMANFHTFSIVGTDAYETLRGSEERSGTLNKDSINKKDNSETLADVHFSMNETVEKSEDRNANPVIKSYEDKNANLNAKEYDFRKLPNAHFNVTETEWSQLYFNERGDVNVSSVSKNEKAIPRITHTKFRFLLLTARQPKTSDVNSRFNGKTSSKALPLFWKVLRELEEDRKMDTEDFAKNFLSGPFLKLSNQNPQQNVERFMMRYNNYILQSINKTVERSNFKRLRVSEFFEILNSSLSSLIDLNIYNHSCIECSVVYKMMLDSGSRNEPKLIENENASFIAILKKPKLITYINGDSSTFVIHIHTDLLFLSPRMYREFQFSRLSGNGAKDDLYPEFALKVPDAYLPQNILLAQGGGRGGTSSQNISQYSEIKRLRQIIFAILSRMIDQQNTKNAVKNETHEVPPMVLLTSRPDFKDVKLSADEAVSNNSIKEENVSNGTYTKRVSDKRFSEVPEKTKVANDPKTDSIMGVKQDINQPATQAKNISEFFEHLLKILYNNENPHIVEMAGKFARLFDTITVGASGESPNVSKKTAGQDESVRKKERFGSSRIATHEENSELLENETDGEVTAAIGNKVLKRPGAFNENEISGKKLGVLKLRRKSASKNVPRHEPLQKLRALYENANESLNEIPGKPSRAKRDSLMDRVKFNQTEDNKGVVLSFRILDSNPPHRIKRDLPQNVWCKIKMMRRHGNVDCYVWTHKKACTVKCHTGYNFQGSQKIEFNCLRKANQWEPDINQACESSEGGGGRGGGPYKSETQINEGAHEEDEEEEDEDYDDDDEDYEDDDK